MISAQTTPRERPGRLSDAPAIDAVGLVKRYGDVAAVRASATSGLVAVAAGR